MDNYQNLIENSGPDRIFADVGFKYIDSSTFVEEMIFRGLIQKYLERAECIDPGECCTGGSVWSVPSKSRTGNLCGTFGVCT